MPEYEESKSGPEKETTAELKSIASQAPSHKLVFDSAAPNPNRILCEISHKSIADNLDEDVKLPEEVVEIFVELGLFESDLFFFGTKFFRDRFRDFFRYQIFSRPIPRLFFGTKFFRDRFRDFFRYQNFSRPIPRLFSVLIFFETGSETFFGTKFFSRPVLIPLKDCKNPGNGTRPGPKSTLIF